MEGDWRLRREAVGSVLRSEEQKKQMRDIFVSLFNDISTFVSYSMPKQSLWWYLTRSWKDKGFHTIQNDIIPKVNEIPRLEFELVYYNITVQIGSHDAQGTSACKNVIQPKLQDQYVLAYVVPSISFQTIFVQAFKIVVDSWKFSILLLYIFWDDFKFKWTATAGIRIHPTKAWLSQLVNFKNVIWT